MAFDVDKLAEYCQSQIEQFARNHSSEMFYAFAIDASLLCLNSVEKFAKTLEEYQSRWDYETRRVDNILDLTEQDLREEKFALDLAEKYNGLDRSDPQAVLAEINKRRSGRRSKGCDYRTAEGIRDLRGSTGDWAYQGFAEMEDENGFDTELYSDHYHEAGESEDGHAPHTAYAIAMNELIDRLRRSEAFRPLNRSDDFSASWVDHTY